MTTAAQVKQIVAPLLEHNGDLALIGRWIYIKPVQHFIRAVLIDRMSDAESFNPRWVVWHLFEECRFVGLNWGELLANRASTRPGLWRTTDPNVAESMRHEIENEALPILRAMKTLEDYLAFVSQHRMKHHLEFPETKVVVEVALGNLPAARRICEANLDHWSGHHPDYDDDSRALCCRLSELCDLVFANDREGLARLLHRWERTSVRNLKIENLWYPTPFPLEQKAK